MKITFETSVERTGRSARIQFMPTPPNSQGRGGGGHKGFRNRRVETTNCELSHPEDGGGGGSRSLRHCAYRRFQTEGLQAGPPACTTSEQMLRRAQLHHDRGRACGV